MLSIVMMALRSIASFACAAERSSASRIAFVPGKTAAHPDAVVGQDLVVAAAERVQPVLAVGIGGAGVLYSTAKTTTTVATTGSKTIKKTQNANEVEIMVFWGQVKRRPNWVPPVSIAIGLVGLTVAAGILVPVFKRRTA
jgi:hypothetical protein